MPQTMMERIKLLKSTPHSAECMEIIEDLMQRLDVARSGAAELVLQAVSSKALPQQVEQRLLEIGAASVGETELDIL